MLRSLTTGAAFALALTTMPASTHAAPAMAEPPPPASFDEADVLAWVDSYIDAVGWSVLAADDGAVALAAPAAPKVLDDATLQAEVRQEYFKPAAIGPMQSRSNLQIWNLDCKGARMRVLAIRIYEGNNLQGAHQERENMQAPWKPLEPGSAPAHAAERLCGGDDDGAGVHTGAPSP
jgi:hypothetical protein